MKFSQGIYFYAQLLGGFKFWKFLEIIRQSSSFFFFMSFCAVLRREGLVYYENFKERHGNGREKLTNDKKNKKKSEPCRRIIRDTCVCRV